MAKYGLIVLAAGGSSRLGFPKQLLNFGGKPLIRHSVETALASACRPVIAVIGSRPEQMRAALDGLTVEMVENALWEKGMATSILTGLSCASRYDLDGVILALADQPLVPAELYNRLIAAHCMTGQPLIAAHYAGACGPPLLVAREYFPRLAQLEGEQGCRHILLGHAETVWVDCPEGEVDIDTPQEYDRALAELTRRTEPQRDSIHGGPEHGHYSLAAG